MQERLSILQQHEVNEPHCMGGPHCILQSAMYSAAGGMDSPYPQHPMPTPTTRGKFQLLNVE